MIKVRIQTIPHGTFPTGFGAAVAEMNKNRAEYKFPFGSLQPLWARQIPYTVVKFVGFETCVEMFYKHVLTAKPKSE